MLLYKMRQYYNKFDSNEITIYIPQWGIQGMDITFYVQKNK